MNQIEEADAMPFLHVHQCNPLLDDNLVQSQLHLCLLHNSLLNCVLCDQSEHLHLFGLPDTVGPILGLQVHLRIPVRVIDDDNVGCGKVDPQPPSSG